MDNDDGLIFLVLGIVVFGALSFGVTKMIKKSLNSTPKVGNVETSRKISEQRQRVIDLKDRQRKLREEQEDRMRDYNRR